MSPASAFRFSPSLIVVADAADGTIVDVNPAFEQQLGYSRADTVGRTIFDVDFLPKLKVQAIRNRARSYAQPEPQPTELKSRDGALLTGSLALYFFTHAERECAVLLIQCNENHPSIESGSGGARNADYQSRLRQSEALYRILVDNCRDGVFLIQHGMILFVNQSLADMFGYRTDEMPSHYMDLVAPESRAEQAQRRDERESGSRATQEYEVFVLHKNGQRRRMRVSAAAIEFNGAMASAGTMHDVTEARNEQQATAAAERKYRALFEHSVTGMFQSSQDGRLIECNDALARILGHADGNALKAAVEITPDLYATPSERERVFAELMRNDRIQGMTFSARRPDNGTVRVELNAHVVRDDAGKLMYIEGSVQDITARNAAERALLQSEARFRTLVEHSQVGVYIMRDDRYTYVNQAFAHIVGYTETQLVGMDFRRLVAEDAMPPLEDRYQRHSRGELVPDGGYETKARRKDGSLIDIVVSAGRLMIDGALHHAGTIRDVTERRHFERELERRATHDMLTGLPNRLFFEQRLAEVIAQSRAANAIDYAVLFFDLDGFNLINDSLGHASGDRLLVSIAEVLRANLDTDVLIARYGGDEFTMLPNGSCPRARAVQIAERVLGLLRDRFQIDGHQVYVGASVGVVLGSGEYQTPEQMLRDADTAMYRAKASGKSSYVVFDDAMHAAARARLKLETDLRLALERREFRVFYQPIVDLADGVVNGFEALVRWQHPERGLLAPEDFLVAADESGIIVAMDWWLLEQVCRQLLIWQRKFPAHAKLRANVNVDERQFADRDVVSTLQAIIKRTGLNPGCLALEVTETVFRQGRQSAEATLRALKDFGVSLVVDDFGTGYSSLDSFATSPFDALKIDHSFVRDMVSNFRHRAIVRTIAGFAEDLGLRLTAEGVETRQQVDLLRTLKCTHAQGYLYAAPLPAELMERVLDDGLTTRKHA